MLPNIHSLFVSNRSWCLTVQEQREIVNAVRACDRKITALEQEAAFLDELFCALLEELMTGRLSALPLVEEKALN